MGGGDEGIGTRCVRRKVKFGRRNRQIKARLNGLSEDRAVEVFRLYQLTVSVARLKNVY